MLCALLLCALLLCALLLCALSARGIGTIGWSTESSSSLGCLLDFLLFLCLCSFLCSFGLLLFFFFRSSLSSSPCLGAASTSSACPQIFTNRRRRLTKARIAYRHWGYLIAVDDHDKTLPSP